MSRIIDFIKREWPALAVIAVATCFQLYLATQSVMAMVQTLIPDDGFFYFSIARNIVAGLGSSLDGVHITNGYHPLWMLVLIPIFKIFSSPFPDLEPIHVAMILQVALITIMSFFVLRIFTRFTQSPWIRAFGLVVLLLNPFFLYGTINGLETPLALCLFSLFFLLALRIEEGHPIGGYWLVGIVGGLMVLARLDMAFYLLAFFIWILFKNGLDRGWRPAAILTVFSSLFILPWIVWNISTFGMVLQTSASGGESLGRHAITIQDHGTSLLQYLKAVIFFTESGLHDYFFIQTGIYGLGSAFLGVFAFLVLRGEIAIARRMSDIPVTLALALGAAVYFISDASVRWGSRGWHYIPFDIFLAIAIVLVMREIMQHVPHKRMIGVVLVGFILFSFLVSWSQNFKFEKGSYFMQNTLVNAALWMNTNLPAGTSVATFTPGIQSYFSIMRIVDIDGLINNSAYEAMKNRQLWNYAEHQASYISTYDVDLNYAYQSLLGDSDPFSHLQLVTEVPDGGGLKIYKISQ